MGPNEIHFTLKTIKESVTVKSQYFEAVKGVIHTPAPMLA